MIFANIAYAETITFGQVGVPTVLDLPIYAAYEKGFFAKKSIELDPIRFPSSSLTFTALMAGDIKFISASTFNAVQDIHNGAPIIIGKAITYTASYLYVRPTINTIAELKNKTIAAGGSNDLTRMHTEIILNANNVKDVNWFWSSDTGKRYLALTSGQLDAAILTPPFTFLADQNGFKLIAKVSDYKLTYHKSLVFGNDWQKKNTEKVKNIIAAIDEAIIWIYNTNNREEAAKIISKNSGISFEDSLKSYDLAIKEKYYILEDTISQSMIDDFITVSKNWGSIKGPIIPLDKLLIDNVKISP